MALPMASEPLLLAAAGRRVPMDQARGRGTCSLEMLGQAELPPGSTTALQPRHPYHEVQGLAEGSSFEFAGPLELLQAAWLKPQNYLLPIPLATYSVGKPVHRQLNCYQGYYGHWHRQRQSLAAGQQVAATAAAMVVLALPQQRWPAAHHRAQVQGCPSQIALKMLHQQIVKAMLRWSSDIVVVRATHPLLGLA